MTLNDFKVKIEQPTKKKIIQDQKKDPNRKLTDQERMILAIGECLWYLDKDKRNEMDKLDKLLAEVDGTTYELTTLKQVINNACELFNIEPKKLVANIKKLFLQEEKQKEE